MYVLLERFKMKYHWNSQVKVIENKIDQKDIYNTHKLRV